MKTPAREYRALPSALAIGAGLTGGDFRRNSVGSVADRPDPVATRALARALARLLWEWAQAGRPPASRSGSPGRDER